VSLPKGYASVIEDDSLAWSKELTLIDPYLEEAPFEELFSDDVLVRAAPNIGLIDSICTEPLDLIPTLLPLLPTTPLIFMNFMRP